MNNIEIVFYRKSVNFEKLKAYGFSKSADIYSYSSVLSASGFEMTVYVTKQGEVDAVVIDPDFNEPYTLHLTDDAAGDFVGGIKAEYEHILTDIADKCFDTNVFESRQAKKIISYVKDIYGDEFEFLWNKFPDNAVVRRKDNQKWYAALLTVSRKKLGFATDEKIEILDVRMTPEDIEKSVDNVKILPGYHMNKKHWITVCLDSTVSMDEIYILIDESYKLAKK